MNHPFAVAHQSPKHLHSSTLWSTFPAELADFPHVVRVFPVQPCVHLSKLRNSQSSHSFSSSVSAFLLYWTRNDSNDLFFYDDYDDDDSATGYPHRRFYLAHTHHLV